jgi:hypothetical protein
VLEQPPKWGLLLEVLREVQVRHPPRRLRILPCRCRVQAPGHNGSWQRAQRWLPAEQPAHRRLASQRVRSVCARCPPAPQTHRAKLRSLSALLDEGLPDGVAHGVHPEDPGSNGRHNHNTPPARAAPLRPAARAAAAAEPEVVSLLDDSDGEGEGEGGEAGGVKREEGGGARPGPSLGAARGAAAAGGAEGVGAGEGVDVEALLAELGLCGSARGQGEDGEGGDGGAAGPGPGSGAAAKAEVEAARAPRRLSRAELRRLAAAGGGPVLVVARGLHTAKLLERMVRIGERGARPRGRWAGRGARLPGTGKEGLRWAALGWERQVLEERGD